MAGGVKGPLEKAAPCFAWASFGIPIGTGSELWIGCSTGIGPDRAKGPSARPRYTRRGQASQEADARILLSVFCSSRERKPYGKDKGRGGDCPYQEPGNRRRRRRPRRRSAISAFCIGLLEHPVDVRYLTYGARMNGWGLGRSSCVPDVEPIAHLRITYTFSLFRSHHTLAHSLAYTLTHSFICSFLLPPTHT